MYQYIDPYVVMTKTRHYIFLPMERDIIVSHDDVPHIDRQQQYDPYYLFASISKILIRKLPNI